MHGGQKYTISCTICNSVYKTKEEMLAHKKNDHEIETKNYACRVCGQSFSKPDPLVSHIETFHRPRKAAEITAGPQPHSNIVAPNVCPISKDGKLLKNANTKNDKNKKIEEKKMETSCSEQTHIDPKTKSTRNDSEQLHNASKSKSDGSEMTLQGKLQEANAKIKELEGEKSELTIQLSLAYAPCLKCQDFEKLKTKEIKDAANILDLGNKLSKSEKELTALKNEIRERRLNYINFLKKERELADKFSFVTKDKENEQENEQEQHIMEMSTPQPLDNDTETTKSAPQPINSIAADTTPTVLQPLNENPSGSQTLQIAAPNDCPMSKDGKILKNASTKNDKNKKIKEKIMETNAKTHIAPKNKSARKDLEMTPINKLKKTKKYKVGAKKSFKCDECDFTCNSFASRLKRHKDSVHNNIKKIVCADCGKKFRDNTGLRVHEENVHQKIRKFVCESCSSKFATKQKLNLHVQNKHTQ